MGRRVARLDLDRVLIQLDRLGGVSRGRPDDREVVDRGHEVGIDAEGLPIVVLGRGLIVVRLRDEAEVVVRELVARVVDEDLAVVGLGLAQATGRVRLETGLERLVRELGFRLVFAARRRRDGEQEGKDDDESARAFHTRR